MILANFHTHTNFCDGQNAPEEMVQAAIKKGCTALGFSGHAYTPCDTSYCMSLEETQAYKAQVRYLQKKYAGQIDIFLGIEQDYFSEGSTDDYDFVIGSVHYINKDTAYLPVDETYEITKQQISQYFSNDPYAYVEEYYRIVADVAEKTNASIIGHFDLITKFNRDGVLFDETNPRYISAALDAIEKLMEKPRIFEINTGAIARGYMDRPYPSSFILKAIHDRGGAILLSSDSHNTDSICSNFGLAERLAKDCGFSYTKILTKDGFRDAYIK